MITEGIYNEQIAALHNHLSNLHLQKLQLVTLPSTKRIITFQTSPKDDLSIAFMIRYNDNYTTPILYFKMSKFEVVNESGLEFESWRPVFQLDQVQKLIKDDSFQVGMTQVDEARGNWWFVHPCDTSELLQNSEDHDYLVNWFSVFGGLFIDFEIDEFMS